MIEKDNLMLKMKNYEKETRYFLEKKQPVIIRLDGKAFHTFTKGLEKPFDKILMETMWETTRFLCDNIQGCKIGYTQSDEISLLLIDYEKEESSAWFDGNIQKMASISSSMATLAFNKNFNEIFNKYNELGLIGEKMKEVYNRKMFLAMFDSRVFILPKEDVNDYFSWREQDAIRNSIQMVGRANFSHSRLNNKSGQDIKDLLLAERNINWDEIPTYEQRGVCVFKEEYQKDISECPEIKKYNPTITSVLRKRWIIDWQIPLFKQDNNYIEKYIY